MPYKLVCLIALLAGLIASPAEARHKRHHTSHITLHNITVSYSRNEQIIGGRPAGCPHAYCGCGARRYLGIDDIRLNLAANWRHLYKGATQVAVWNHHIAIIEQHLGNGMALLRDYNSGGGLSRIHERSIAGATIVGGGSDYSAASIHHKTATRNVAGRRGNQESYGTGQFVNVSQPIHRDFGVSLADINPART